jgi:sulfate permease, SulP family
MIAGSAGVIALPMAKLVASHGLPYMAAAVILSSVLQLLFGVFRASSLLDVVTEPVVCGFLNALGIFLLQTQLKVFRAAGNLVWLDAATLLPTLAAAGLCLGITRLLPLLARHSLVPPSLVGLLVSSLFVHAMQWPRTAHLKLLSDLVGKQYFQGGLAALPQFTGMPDVPISQATLAVLGSTVVSISELCSDECLYFVWFAELIFFMFVALVFMQLGTAAISIVETLLAGRVAAEKFQAAGAVPVAVAVGKHADSTSSSCPSSSGADRSVVGTALGNLAAAFFGGFGGCGLIPNTLLNGGSGGVGYVSGYAYAIFLGLAVVVGAPLLGQLPMAALAGVMVNVAFNTFQWDETFALVRGGLRGATAVTASSSSSSSSSSFLHHHHSSPHSASSSSTAPISASASATHPLQQSLHLTPGPAERQLQRCMDLLAMVATTLICWKKDMGLGVAAGVALAQAPTAVRLLRAKLQQQQQQ